MPATKKDCLNATSYLGIRTDNGARHRPKSKIVPDWFVETTIFFVIMVSIFSKSQTLVCGGKRLILDVQPTNLELRNC